MKSTEAHIEAARLLLYSVQQPPDDTSAEPCGPAAGRVYETLCETLTPIIGAAGFRALFIRSVKLAGARHPCLSELLVRADSSDADAPVAQQLKDCLSKLDRAAAWEAATGLYATLLGLLTTFIGERMVWQLLKRTFPALEAAGPKETA